MRAPQELTVGFCTKRGIAYGLAAGLLLGMALSVFGEFGVSSVILWRRTIVGGGTIGGIVGWIVGMLLHGNPPRRTDASDAARNERKLFAPPNTAKDPAENKKT